MSATAFPEGAAPKAPGQHSMNSRATAATGLVIVGIATAYIVALLLGMPDPDWAYLARAIIHLGELAAVVAVTLAGAAGTGWLGRAGAGVAGLGLVLMAIAEAITVSGPDLSTTLFMIAPNLVGLGLILVGIAVIRTSRLTGWRRYPVLVLGVYVFVVMTPLIIISGGPPAPLGLVALAGWEVLFALIAVSVLVETATERRGAAPALG
jgi:hypothetical protein